MDHEKNQGHGVAGGGRLSEHAPGTGQRLALITGAHGRLGRHLVPALRARGWSVAAPSSADLDITDRVGVLAAVETVRPEAVINLAAYADVDGCERHPDRAFGVNATAVGHLAEACSRVGAHLCHVSSDYVFDGTKRTPYQEGDQTNPLSVYGRSKLAGEGAAGAEATVVRSAWLLSEHSPNVVTTVLQLPDDGPPLSIRHDQIGSPTAAGDLAEMLVRLADQPVPGVVHATNQGQATWLDIARHVLITIGADPERARPAEPVTPGPGRAPRPVYSVLDNAALRARGVDLMPDWQSAVNALVRRAQAGQPPP